MPRLRPHRQRMTSTFAAPLQAAHDLVFFDQRGAGRSTPSLACPGWHETFVDNFSEARTIAEDGARLVDAMRTCHERLANDGINFAAYTSAAIAADVGDLMAALGYTHWHLYGFSYGARVALNAMRDMPEAIRSVVLDSTLAVQANLQADFAANAERGLNTLFAACAADASCAAKYPHLDQTFFQVVDQLNATPAVVDTVDASGLPLRVVVTGDRFLLGVIGALPDETLVPFLPALIATTAQGNNGLLAPAAAVLVGTTDLNAEGMQYSVLCADEVPFSTPQVIAAATSGVREEIKRVEVPYLTDVPVDICRFWGSPPSAAIEDEPVASDLPTVILGGQYDPIQPYGPLAAQTLSDSFYFLFPGQGHGQVFGFYDPNMTSCGIQIMAEFFADPTRAPDASCLAALPATHFL